MSCVIKATLGLVWLFGLEAAARADDFRVAWPIDCQLGVDCSIQQYVDRDATDGVLDFQCGTLSYDGHKGTDIRVPTVQAMKAGMAVLAAQTGTVAGVRDGMPDIDITAEEAVDVFGKECGNGVVISHGDGWETQYCHLRQSSVQVRPGDRVRQGQRLGEVGMSGRAAFPHLEFLVRRTGAVVDPFSSESVSGCASQNLDQLWLVPVPYVPTGVLDAGFSTELPAYAAVEEGIPAMSSLTHEATALVIWATYFGPRAGDRMRFMIKGPEGFEFEHDYTVERDQAQAMRAAGRRKPRDGWPPGTYTATITYTRDAALQWRVERQTSVLP